MIMIDFFDVLNLIIFFVIIAFVFFATIKDWSNKNISSYDDLCEKNRKELDGKENG